MKPNSIEEAETLVRERIVTLTRIKNATDAADPYGRSFEENEFTWRALECIRSARAAALADYADGASVRATVRRLRALAASRPGLRTEWPTT